MIKDYLENKKLKIKPICEKLKISYYGFRSRLDNNTVRFLEIKSMYKSGYLTREDIDKLLEQ